jgi:ATP-dependent Lon protease
MFCVGVREQDDEVLPVVTAGLIRASMKNADGTSQVMLFGVNRMRITGWEQAKPFRIAQVEPLLTKKAPPEALRELKLQALELLPLPTDDSCESMQKLRNGLEQMDEDETV